MKRAEKIIVKRIEWLNTESDLILVCENSAGNLSYNSRISLPSTCLNQIVSDMQKQHPELEVNDCLKIEQWSESDTYFIYDFESQVKREFLYQPTSNEFIFTQIRA